MSTCTSSEPLPCLSVFWAPRWHLDAIQPYGQSPKELTSCDIPQDLLTYLLLLTYCTNIVQKLFVQIPAAVRSTPFAHFVIKLRFLASSRTSKNRNMGGSFMVFPFCRCRWKLRRTLGDGHNVIRKANTSSELEKKTLFE